MINRAFFVFLLSVFCLTATAQIPQQITGNWINQTTNDWDYGFFEDFAIYNCGFWQYQSISNDGKKTVLVLQQDNQIVKLEISTKSDSTITVKNGKQKSQEYLLMKTRYPDYKTKDIASFPSPEFKQDSATIIGYYRNLDKIPQGLEARFGHNYFEISVPNFIKDEDIDYRTSIDSLGRFMITFPIVNTQYVYADWQRINGGLVLQPGDVLFLFVDMADFIPQGSDGNWTGYNKRPKQVLYMGKNARLHNEIQQYSYHSLSLNVNAREEVKNGVMGMALLRKYEDVNNKEKQHLDDYISKYTVSDRFVTYKKESLRYDFARNLMQHRFDLFGKENTRFEDGYIEYVNKTFPLYNKNVYGFIRDYKTFLRDYVGYVGNSDSQTFFVGLEDVIEVLEREGKIIPERKNQLNEFLKLNQQLQAMTDTTEQRKLLEVNIDLVKSVNSDSLILQMYQELLFEMTLKQELSVVDSILSEPIVKEWYMTSVFYKRLDHNHSPLKKREWSLFEERISNPYFRSQITTLNDYYTEINQQSMKDEGSLKNTDHLSDVYDPKVLLDSLIKPYKGKIIFLDFWGTWCRPCRENMKLAGAIEEALHGEDVIFMYLANNSPEQSWRNIIKEMNLTGENIVHYHLPDRQQKILEQMLSIRSFPTYMIINREGEIVNRNAVSPPMNKDKVVSTIKEYLRK